MPIAFPDRPKAVLLDVGGIFFLPLHDRILGAFDRAGCAPDAAILDRAHYAGARTFPARDDEREWAERWHVYLEEFIATCGIAPELREEVHVHLDSEFADAALWLQELPGCREGLLELSATDIRLGIVSNADGLIAQRLADAEILQVGPGVGVEVDCIIDSGAVGVSKPDPRIFQIALDAMSIEPGDAWYLGDMPGIDIVGARAAGLFPIVMDPYEFHLDADYARIGSLSELAAILEPSPTREP